MRVVVDRDRCVGSGMCTSIAPGVFELDDVGGLVLKRDEVADEADQAAVNDAVACCPVEALSVR